MIRFKTIITFRDDKSKTYDCLEFPQQSDSYWCLQTTADDREYIPKEAIKSLKVKDYWKK